MLVAHVTKMGLIKELSTCSTRNRMAISYPSVRHNGELFVTGCSSSRDDAFCAQRIIVPNLAKCAS